MNTDILGLAGHWITNAAEANKELPAITCLAKMNTATSERQQRTGVQVMSKRVWGGHGCKVLHTQCRVALFSDRGG